MSSLGHPEVLKNQKKIFELPVTGNYRLPLFHEVPISLEPAVHRKEFCLVTNSSQTSTSPRDLENVSRQKFRLARISQFMAKGGKN